MTARRERREDAIRQAAASRVRLAIPAGTAAWKTLSDLGHAHCCQQGIIRTGITTAQSTGLGTSRRVCSGRRRYINETVLA